MHFGQKYHRNDASFSVYDIRRHMMSLCPMTGVFILITWLRWCLPGCCPIKLLFFTLYLTGNLLRDIVRVCKYLVSHLTFTSLLWYLLVILAWTNTYYVNNFLSQSFLLHLFVGILQKRFPFSPLIELIFFVIVDVNLLFILRFQFSHIWLVGAILSSLWVLFDKTLSFGTCIFWHIKLFQLHFVLLMFWPQYQPFFQWTGIIF